MMKKSVIRQPSLYALFYCLLANCHAQDLDPEGGLILASPGKCLYLTWHSAVLDDICDVLLPLCSRTIPRHATGRGAEDFL
jgi:hypothetical protein